MSAKAPTGTKPPTSGSALLQFVAAALRSENMQTLQESDFSAEDDDMVHINDAHGYGLGGNLEALLGPNYGSQSSYAMASDAEDSEDERRASTSDAGGHSGGVEIVVPPRLDRQRTKSQDVTKSTSGISFGVFRDKKSIAEKLQAAFNYPELEDFIGEYSCWLARSVLLPGYMYLTTNHLCFYANLPNSQDVTQKEGFFSKKSKTTKQFTRYWFILKNDVLSYYGNQTDVYYPIKTINLKHALSAEPSPTNDLHFHIFTNSRKYTFRTDSELGKTDWVKAIQKAIFHAKMEGDKVKISIPLANVLDVEMNTMAFAEAIQVKVMESDESFAVDEYYFAYFNDTTKTLNDLKTQVRKYQSQHAQIPDRSQRIYDSTSPNAATPRKTPATTYTTIAEVSHRPPPISTPSIGSQSMVLPMATPPPANSHAPVSHNNSLPALTSGSHSSSSSSIPRSPVTSYMAKYLHPHAATALGIKSLPTSDAEDSMAEKDGKEAGGTPKEKSTLSTARSAARNSLSFSIRGTTSWITDHLPEMSTNMITGGSNASSEEQLAPLSEKEQESFRKDFALAQTERLHAMVPGYLLRILPLYGRIFLSENYICFKSKLYGTRTKVIVPLADIQSCNKHKGTRFYFHGLSLLTKTDEEIFLEFSLSETRNSILEALQSRITPEAQEMRTKRRAQVVAETPSVELDDPLECRIMDSLQLREEPVHIEPLSWGTSSSLHPGFKPSRPMHITCLTIGSRGDVQPYIALCKRLMQDGHTCRISTHGEYKDWIEGHGIEFGLVGGDPGELIELCVENGMFTVSFFREGMKRFRGWLDELMDTAWKACQGTDVLIESPSAMAGIHIAERLDIPYFRAFPFPWTRTRAFPHPFAVPEHNLGRGYNYMTYVMIEQVFWKGISGQVNKWRKDTLHLGPTSLEKMEAHRVPSLYSWSPNVLPAPMDWHSWIHVTGYWFLDNPDLNWEPPKDLIEFLNADKEKKPVYIGFGSMVVPDPDGMTRIIIEAVVKSGVRAIISKGWSDRLVTLDDGSVAAVTTTPKKQVEALVIPSNVFMLKSVPHDWLFPQLAGVVHHGGAGTTAAGLRAGIPTVIKPYFGDQYFWAQRVEEAGVGVWCHDLTVKKLTTALVQITTDEKMIKKAQMIGEKIRQEDGVGTAVQYFYHDLALAKQRLNKNNHHGSRHHEQHRAERSEDTPVNFKVQEAEDEWLFVQPSANKNTGGDGATGTGATSGGGHHGGGEGVETASASASASGASESTGVHVMSGSEEDFFSNGELSDMMPFESYTTDGNNNSASDLLVRPTSPLTRDIHHTETSKETNRFSGIYGHGSHEDELDHHQQQQQQQQQHHGYHNQHRQSWSSPGNSPPLEPTTTRLPAHMQGYSHGDVVASSKTGTGTTSKHVKRTSTARKVIESLATKATHMTGYFSPGMGSPMQKTFSVGSGSGHDQQQVPQEVGGGGGGSNSNVVMMSGSPMVKSPRGSTPPPPPPSSTSRPCSRQSSRPASPALAPTATTLSGPTGGGMSRSSSPSPSPSPSLSKASKNSVKNAGIAVQSEQPQTSRSLNIHNLL